MYTYNEPYSIKEIIPVTGLVAATQNISINGRKLMVSNTGAQPAYFKEKSIDGVDCTAANGFLLPANTVFPQVLNAVTLSVISNATGTTLAIMILDI